jgi:23S rRNA (adenine2030-N6)-methyltransferase
MFSYRHAFHAGNHADVLKHAVLIAIVRHLVQKPTPITVIDTHAGVGIYDLTDKFAATSGEAASGIALLQTQPREQLSPLLVDYLEVIDQFNVAADKANVYPGSPLIIHKLLRPTDRLKLFELHPTDAPLLANNIAQLHAGRQVTAMAKDGFAAAKALLPPPSRRGLVLCDPSYEVKTDYAAVVAMLGEGLKRFATGTYCLWYPLLERPEARALPQQLMKLSQAAGRQWLHVQLQVKASAPVQAKQGLHGSALFVVNPPYTLAEQLRQALPILVGALAQDDGARWQLDLT